MNQGKINIVAVGDIMPGGILHGTDQPCVSEEVLRLLQNGDVRVGTLECAIGNEPIFCKEKLLRDGDLVYAFDEDIKRLLDLNINVVSLANNHFYDLGSKGASHTIELLDKYGILHCGAGENLLEAQKPAVVTINGKTIAFLGFCDYHNYQYMGWIPYANRIDAGVNPLQEELTLSLISKTKSKYDYVVAMPHWGIEHTYEVTSWVERMSRKMLLAGADLILGSHPHRVQPVINYRRKSIVYSMGNFLFPDRLIAPPLRSTFYPKSSLDISKLPVVTDYPVVSEPTYKIWPPLARIGMIVKSSINNRSVRSSYYLTELDSVNHISVCKDGKEIKKALNKYGFLMRYCPYEFAIKVLKRISIVH